MRKPIQIAATENNCRTVYALCDDGTMWITKKGEWTQIKYIPQDPETLDKCQTLAFDGINKQASEINSALDAENERLNWKVEKMRESLRLIRGHALNNSGSYLGIIYDIAKRAMEETE